MALPGTENAVAHDQGVPASSATALERSSRLTAVSRETPAYRPRAWPGLYPYVRNRVSKTHLDGRVLLDARTKDVDAFQSISISILVGSLLFLLRRMQRRLASEANGEVRFVYQSLRSNVVFVSPTVEFVRILLVIRVCHFGIPSLGR